MAIIHDSGGKMFLSGSTYFLRDGQYWIESSYDNELFVNNTLDWFKQDIKVYPNNISVPEDIPVGTTYPIYINITNEDSSDMDVNVTLSIINLDSGVKIQLDQNFVQLGTITVGSYKNFQINAQAFAPGKALLMINITAKPTSGSNDIISYSKVVPLEVIGLKITVSPSTTVKTLPNLTNQTFQVIVSNTLPYDVTDVKLEVETNPNYVIYNVLNFDDIISR